jgi:hypothetical protein
MAKEKKFNLKKFLAETTPADRRSRLEEAGRISTVYQELLMFHGLSAFERARLESLYDFYVRNIGYIELAIEAAGDEED